MPRTNNPKEYVRAYHRASAILRELHLDEWNQIRLEILGELIANPNPDPLPAGPRKGQGAARRRHERRVQNYDDLAREHQALKDALVITNSYLRDVVHVLQETDIWPKEGKDIEEQLKVNTQLIEETKGL